MSAEAVIAALRKSHMRLATAESCTGGGLGQALTTVPGASEVYLGGIIAYANAVKSSLLDVPPAMIREHGAVSSEVAQAMARGVLKDINATMAISVTGIAGPGGGSAEKPVGTVYIGLARRRGAEITTSAQHFIFKNQDRHQVRTSTHKNAFKMLLDALG